MDKSHGEKSLDAKLEEMTLKSLGVHTSLDEKLNILVKKYVEIEKEHKKSTATIKQLEKRSELIQREKEVLQKEYNKGVLIKDKLEQVCREQQKLIKSVKNESMSKIREEEERRKENQQKFQQSFNDIHATLSKNNEENNKLRDDNIEMSKKLKYLAQQYENREKQLEKITEQISLDSQLHEAKFTKLQMEAAIEKEVVLREKQMALDELLSCKKVIMDFQSRETALKDQIHLYTTKYDDFQNSLEKSNHIFTTYKTELEKMAKNTKKLEKENIELRRKFEISNARLLEMATEKQAKDEYVTKCAKQVNQLQKLLRTLQAERTILHQVLKDNNIERPPVPVVPVEPEPIISPLPPPPAHKDKVELMQKNCAELKQTLAKLQGQMNAISAKTEMKKPTSERETNSKKNKKNKKNKNKTCPTKVKDNDVEESKIQNDTPNKAEIVTETETDEVIETKPALESANDDQIQNQNENTEQKPEVANIENVQSHDRPMNLEDLVAAVLANQANLSSKSTTAKDISSESEMNKDIAEETHVVDEKLEQVPNEIIDNPVDENGPKN